MPRSLAQGFLALLALAIAVPGLQAAEPKGDRCELARAARSLPPTSRLGEMRKVIDQSDLKEWPASKKYTWQRFSTKPQLGDCVVAFSNVTAPQAPLNGDAEGYLLIRRGTVVDRVVTSIR